MLIDRVALEMSIKIEAKITVGGISMTYPRLRVQKKVPTVTSAKVIFVG